MKVPVVGVEKAAFQKMGRFWENHFEAKLLLPCLEVDFMGKEGEFLFRRESEIVLMHMVKYEKNICSHELMYLLATQRGRCDLFRCPVSFGCMFVLIGQLSKLSMW